MICSQARLGFGPAATARFGRSNAGHFQLCNGVTPAPAVTVIWNNSESG
jgi:hypothetical protein